MPIANLKLDPDIYPRLKTNPQTVYRYAQVLKAGKELKPVTAGILSDKVYLLDGEHRRQAHLFCHLKTIDVEEPIKQYTDKKEMRYDAYQLNSENALQLSNQEINLGIYRLTQDGFSKEQIVNCFKIPIDKLEKRRIRIQVGKNGKLLSPKKAFWDVIQKQGIASLSPKETEELREVQDNVNVNRISILLSQIISILKWSLFPVKDENIMGQILEIHKLIDERFS